MKELRPACVAKRCPVAAECRRHKQHGPNPFFIGALKDFSVKNQGSKCKHFARVMIPGK